MKYILFLSLLILSFISQAAPDPACSMRGTRVIYTNGVQTSYLDAGKAMEKIEELGFQYNFNSKIDSRSVKYKRAYNYEESYAKDILESTVQRLPQSYLNDLQVANAYAAYSQFLQGNLVQSITSTILNSITEKKLEILATFSINYSNLPNYKKTIDEIRAKYEGAFLRGERIFAISHSQGSLFMNDVYNLLPENENKIKYFTGFQIASVLYSKMDTRFDYATNSKDRVVDTVRIVIGALPANIETPLIVSNDGFDTDEYLNHGILSTYLFDSKLRAQVISRLTATVNLQESNCFYANIEYTKNNLVVNFDSTDPEDPNVTGLTYSWNFGDSQTSNTTSKILSHEYSQPGTYKVSLTVTDIYGASDTAGASVIVQGCTNCDTPQIKIFATGATETSSGIFKTPSAGQSTRVSIDVVDLNNDKGTTVFTIRYNEYRYDINTYPFNIFTNATVIGDSASIPVPFASTSYTVNISAYNPTTKKYGYATAIISSIADAMPTVSPVVSCYQYTDSNGNLVNTGSGDIRIGARDADSSKIFIGVWYPNQSTGVYEGNFTDNAIRSPSGYFYSFNNYEFNERETVYAVDFANRNDVRIIYENSDGSARFVTVTNSCKN